jgi:hypothetical protein
MIDGAHVIVYSHDAEADRAFLRDILRSNSVDAGDGWLIFALPPAEIAVHPTDEQPRHEVYLMCDDIDRTIAELSGHGAEVSSTTDAGWGVLATIKMPSGATLPLYQPRHPVAHSRGTSS